MKASVDPRFAARLPFPVPESVEFGVFRDLGNNSLHSPGIFTELPSGTPKEIMETATALSSFLNLGV